MVQIVYISRLLRLSPLSMESLWIRRQQLLAEDDVSNFLKSDLSPSRPTTYSINCNCFAASRPGFLIGKLMRSACDDLSYFLPPPVKTELSWEDAGSSERVSAEQVDEEDLQGELE